MNVKKVPQKLLQTWYTNTQALIFPWIYLLFLEICFLNIRYHLDKVSGLLTWDAAHGCMRCRGGSSVGDRVVSALLTTQRGLPPTALPPRHPTYPLPRRMMLRKHHPSSSQLLSELSDLLPGPDNLRTQGVLQGQLCSQSATQGGSRSASQPGIQSAGQSAGGHLLVLTTKKNFLSSPPITPGTTPTNMPTLESRERRSASRSNGRSCHTLFHVALKQTATKPKPLISPADTSPLEGSDGLPAVLPSHRVSRLLHYVILQGSKGPFV